MRLQNLSGNGYPPDNAPRDLNPLSERFKTMHPHEHEQHPEKSSASTAGDEVLLPTHQVLAWLGNISAMTLWRWLHSERVRFPPPTLIVNNRRYWSAGSIRRWLAERGSAEAAA
jgi:predicted DNA-binding transcriptional regulator AlpA